MDHIDFIIKVETGTLTDDEFVQHAQAFVDSGVWKSLQGSWQRTVYHWANCGHVVL